MLDDDIVAEACYAKNALINVHGSTPYIAVMGRHPHLLRDFDALGPPDDDEGGITGISRHCMRLREIALSQMIQGTAKDRMARAANSKTRLSLDRLELKPGDVVDIYRALPKF